jgi:hypothetical protein
VQQTGAGAGQQTGAGAGQQTGAGAGQQALLEAMRPRRRLNNPARAGPLLQQLLLATVTPLLQHWAFRFDSASRATQATATIANAIRQTFMNIC